MKAVSAAYKASMNAGIRNRSYVRVILDNVDTKAATDGQWSGEGTAFSEVETLDYEYAYGNTIATLELNRWMLDGSQDIFPEDAVSDGFISSQMSDADGNFTVSAAVNREFSEIRSLPGLTLTFDSRTEEYPQSVTVRFLKDDDTVYEAVLAPIKAAENEIVCGVNATKIELTFGSGLPYRRPRLENVLFGVKKVFGNHDLLSVELSHDVDPLSRRLPNETMKFTILDYAHNYDPENPTGVYQYIDVKSPVEVVFGYELTNGEIEWLKGDKYVLNAKPSVINDQATFTGTGVIGSLSGMYRKSKLGSKSLYDMAEAVLLDAGLQPTSAGTSPWMIDKSLKTMYTTAVLPIASHASCLQLIAHACRCRLYTDDDNIIHIESFGVTLSGIYRGAFSDNGAAWWSSWSGVDKGDSSAKAYATLELNRWTLDGSQALMTDGQTGTSFASSVLSDAAGGYDTPPIVSRTFDVLHQLSGVALRFDTATGGHPRTIALRYYDSQGEQIAAAEAVISSQETFIELPGDNCSKIEIEAVEMLPYSRFRLEKVYYRENDFTLNFNSITENSQTVAKIDQLKAVSVAQYSYSSADSPSELYSGVTEENVLQVTFPLAQDVQVSVTGGELVSAEIYAQGADLKFSGEGTKTITIIGTALQTSSAVVLYPVASDGEDDVEENPLITNASMRDALAAHVKSYLTMRNTYDQDYRGNPEVETGDVIGLQTRYSDEIDALVLVDTITFSGALSGSLKVKGLI